VLGLSLHLNERISRRQHVGDQLAPTECRDGKVADLMGRRRCAAQQIAAGLHMFCPGLDKAEDLISRGLEPLESVSFAQLIAKPGKAIPGLRIAEGRTGEHPNSNVGDARSVAVAMLETEIDAAAGRQ